MTPQLVTLTAVDAPEIVPFCARALPYEEWSPALARYTLLQTDDAEPDVALGLRVSGQLVAVAIGAANNREGRVSGFVKLVATERTERRRGHCRILLGELEQRLHDLGATAVAIRACRRYLVPGVDVRYSEALCLFDRAGYQRGHTTYNLEVDLTREPILLEERLDQLRQHHIEIRRFERDDEGVLDAYLRQYWSPGWRFEGLEALHLGSEPVPGFAAWKDGAIIGFAVYDVTRPGWFGPIGTNPEERSSGVGGALLLQCLRDWQLAGRQRGEIAAIGPLYFYVSTCGARTSRAFVTYHKELS
ncbi:MAG: GNAT family N-acetyltransferase [Chloroflexi bacterium]|nr:GNAT family N-acetyltransferase [Chloroflexota bacterium]